MMITIGEYTFETDTHNERIDSRDIVVKKNGKFEMVLSHEGPSALLYYRLVELEDTDLHAGCGGNV